jgi:ribosome-associated protein
MRHTVADGVVFDDRELEWDFIRSSGPGGQNVNKVATAVQLRFDAGRSRGLPEDVRERLIRLAGRRMTSDGFLVIHARRFRSQEGNRKDALARLEDLIRRALVRPAVRRPTRPSRSAKQRRLEAKKRRAVLKQERSGRSDPSD